MAYPGENGPFLEAPYKIIGNKRASYDKPTKWTLAPHISGLSVDIMDQVAR